LSFGWLIRLESRAAAEGGFQPGILPAVPWLRGGYFYSSGDGNPNGDVHGTFFPTLPTPRVYARFPFFNEVNNRDLFGELMLRPRKKLEIRSDVHGLWLANRNDLWYSRGSAFQPGPSAISGAPRMAPPDWPRSTIPASTTDGRMPWEPACISAMRAAAQ
jgi:hypothetical protein